MNKDIENMKKKSTSGNIGKKTGHKMNITREDYLKRFQKNHLCILFILIILKPRMKVL